LLKFILNFETAAIYYGIDKSADYIFRIEVIEYAQNNADRRSNYIYLSLRIEIIAHVAI